MNRTEFVAERLYARAMIPSFQQTPLGRQDGHATSLPLSPAEITPYASLPYFRSCI